MNKVMKKFTILRIDKCSNVIPIKEKDKDPVYPVRKFIISVNPDVPDSHKMLR